MTNYEEWIIEHMRQIIQRNAINPEFGGPGEKERADYIEKIISDMGFDYRRYDVMDHRGITRSNIIVTVRGKGEKLWLLAHLDTVGVGSGWTKPPLKLTVEGNRVYGRGVSDNGVGIASLLLLLKMIADLNIEPQYELKLLFVADEEAGSKYGVKYLIDKGIIDRSGMAIVPDFGSKTGDILEIAEKGIVWLKLTVKGKPGHASMPHLADNANIKAARLIVELYDKLYEAFPKRNEFFDPPYSTFEPTKREANTDSINQIPGEDVGYWDLRIIPEYKIDDVIEFIKKNLPNYAQLEEVMREEASYTPPDSKIVVNLSNAIRSELGITPKLIGIGGGTVAGVLRKIGIPSVAWSINSGTEHTEDEYELIDNYIKTAKVFLRLVSPLEY